MNSFSKEHSLFVLGVSILVGTRLVILIIFLILESAIVFLIIQCPSRISRKEECL